MIPTATDEPGGDRYAEWDAAYVLGALSPSDRRAYERHLTGCTTCRTAVAELAGLPGLLSTLTPAHAEALVPETDMTGAPASAGVSLASLAGAAHRSRVRRRSLGAVAASALLVAGAIGGSALAGRTPDGAGAAPPAVTAAGTARTIELRPVGDTDLRAELVATPTTWGTSLRWRCSYPPAPGRQPSDASHPPAEPIRYELVLVGHDGARTIAGTWSWSGGPTAGLDASSAVQLAEVDRIEIALDGHEEALAAAKLPTRPAT